MKPLKTILPNIVGSGIYSDDSNEYLEPPGYASWWRYKNQLAEVYPSAVTKVIATPLSKFVDPVMHPVLAYENYRGPYVESPGIKLLQNLLYPDQVATSIFGSGVTQNWEYSPAAIPFKIDEIFPSPASWDDRMYASSLEGYTRIQRTLDYFRSFKKAIGQEIAYFQNEYLFDGSSDVIQEKRKKLAAAESAIDALQVVVTNPESDHDQWAASDAESFLKYLGTAALPLEREYPAGTGEWGLMFALSAVSARPLFHIFFQRGRFRRYIFKRPLRDKRRYFRTLVRILFKQMDDQSGHDGFLTIDQLNAVRDLSFPKTWLSHGTQTYYRAA